MDMLRVKQYHKRLKRRDIFIFNNKKTTHLKWLKLKQSNIQLWLYFPLNGKTKLCNVVTMVTEATTTRGKRAWEARHLPAALISFSLRAAVYYSTLNLIHQI